MNQPSNELVGVKRIQHYSYVLSEEIGKGYSSNVYRGKDDKTNQVVAVKVVNHKTLDQFHKDLLNQEIACLKELRNQENILQLLDVYATTNNTYIITELCDTKDLAKLIKVKSKIDEEATIGIMRQLINGTMNMQKHRIIHRDLKPMNIFFKNGVVKIADFGFAFREGTPVQKYNLGSPSYMAPEVLGENRYSYKSDIWALGVIMYQMLHGKVPWQSNNEMILHAFISQEAIETIVREDVKGKPALLNFMKRCCTPDYNRRMGPQELAQYDFKMGGGEKRGGVNSSTIIDAHNPHVTKSPRPQSIVVTNPIAPNPPSNQHIQHQVPQVISHVPHPSNLSQRQIIPPQSNVVVTNIPTLATIPPHITPHHPPPQILLNSTDARSDQQRTDRHYHTMSMNEDDLWAIAKQAVIAQIQYCRFSMLIVENIEKLEDGEIKRELFDFFANEVLQKIGLLFGMASHEENILQLQGFHLLLKHPEWPLIKDMIVKYRTKYMRYFGRDSAHYNSHQASIINGIKYLNASSTHHPLLEQLVILYQIKLLEKKVDYNEFGEASKIDNVVLAMTNNKPDFGRLKNKIALLGL